MDLANLMNEQTETLGKRGKEQRPVPSGNEYPKAAAAVHKKWQDPDSHTVTTIQAEINDHEGKNTDYVTFLRELRVCLHVQRTLAAQDQDKNPGALLSVITTSCMENKNLAVGSNRRKCMDFILKNRSLMEDYLDFRSAPSEVTMAFAENYVESMVRDVINSKKNERKIKES